MSDADLVASIPVLEARRALEVSRTGGRAAALVARTYPVWPDSLSGELLGLWGTAVGRQDRLALDALVGSLPLDALVGAVRAAPAGLIGWDCLEERARVLGDLDWLAVVEASGEHAGRLSASAASRGEVGRVALVLRSDGVDTAAVLAHLARIGPLEMTAAQVLVERFSVVLARFGRLRGGLVELDVVGPATSDVAALFAGCVHPGLRRVAARSAVSDTLVRGRLLADEDSSLDAAFCEAPLNLAEIALLMDRLRSRPMVEPASARLLFQPEPLATKDRLWILRGGMLPLTQAWLGGESAQDPRVGEVAALLGNPGTALAAARSRPGRAAGAKDGALLEIAAGTHWVDELEEALAGL